MTQNLADATLALHKYLLDTFLELMSEGDEAVTPEDLETTRELVDILVDALDLEVTEVDGNTYTLRAVIPTA